MAFNEARQNVPDPQVSKLKPQAFTSDGTANAISKVGALGGEIRKGFLLGQQDNKIGELTDAAAVLNAQTEGVNDIAIGKTVNLEDLPGAERVSDVREKFKFLRAAQDQGRITGTAVKLEAEAILREQINSAPGFANEFRSEAAKLLGFDPSGALIQSVLSAITEAPKERKISDEEKQNQQDIENAALIGVSVKDIKTMRAEASFFGDATKATNGKINLGKLKLPGIIAESRDQFNTAARLAVLGAFESFQTNGGEVDTTEIRFRLREAMNEIVIKRQQFMASPASGASFDQASINSLSSVIEQDFDKAVTSIEELDVLKAMVRNESLMMTAIEIAGLEALPTIALLESVSPTFTDIYLNALNTSGGNSKLFEFLSSQIPELRSASKVADAATGVTEAFEFLLGGKSALPTGEALVALDGITAAGLAHPDDEFFSKSVETRLNSLKLPAQTLNLLGQQANSYSRLTSKVKKDVQTEIVSTQTATLNNLVAELTGSGGFLAFNEDRNEFMLVDRDGIPFDPTLIQKGQLEQDSSGLESIQRLNDVVLRPIQASPGILRDQKLSQSEFINGVLLAVNPKVIAFEAVDPTFRDPKGPADQQQLTPEAALAINKAVASKDIGEIVRVANENGLGDFSAFLEDLSADRSQFFLDPETGQVITTGKVQRN